MDTKKGVERIAKLIAAEFPGSVETDEKRTKYLVTVYDGESEDILLAWESDHDRVMKEIETHYPGCDWTVTELSA